MAGDAVEVFFSYSHQDEALRDQLANHLKLLERQSIISAWHDRKIVPGAEWAGDIHNYLARADIILLLVSADFLASDYCWDVEIAQALERHAAGEAIVIPVILRPVDWSSAPFAQLQALPKNAQPVTTWNPTDLAFVDIAKGIRAQAEALVAERQARQNQRRQQAALAQYRQKVSAYLVDGGINFVRRQTLEDLAQNLGLNQADVEMIEAEETDNRNTYLANLKRYGQTFRQALDHEIPLSQRTKADLKERQVSLQLRDIDVRQLEARILAEWEAEQHRQQEEQSQIARLRQKLQALDRLRQEQAELDRLRQQQAEVERQDRERQQQEAADQMRREQAEAVRQGQERQRQAAEALMRQRAEADRLARLRRPLQPTPRSQPSLSRRRMLQVAGFGGGGLMVALVANSLNQQPQEQVDFPEPPPVAGTSPDDLSAVDIQTVTVNERGRILERKSAQVQAFQEDLGNDIKLPMVAIPAGEFVMGSPAEEEGRSDAEGPQRTVQVPAFLMGRFAVTQAQYQAVMGANPSRFSENGANRPVERVSWNDAVAFCEKLSQQTGRTYRLPSEAEWEYACRADTATPFHFGPTITTDLANYHGGQAFGNGPTGIDRGETTDVGSFSANAFGLYDMHGNVWEWCQDVWHGNYENAPTDGRAWLEGGDQNTRVRRGGSWISFPRFCRSASRNGAARAIVYFNVGFRVVLSPA